jgi:hypothetical protein
MVVFQIYILFIYLGAFGEAWKCSILNEEYKKKYKDEHKYESEFIVSKFQIDQEGITSSYQVNKNLI